MAPGVVERARWGLWIVVGVLCAPALAFVVPGPAGMLLWRAGSVSVAVAGVMVYLRGKAARKARREAMRGR